MKAERCDQGWNLSFRGSDDSIVTEKLMAVTGVTSIPNLRLIGKFWDVVTHLSDSHAGYSKGDHISLLKPEVDRKSVFWANSGLGVVTLTDFWPKIHSGNVRVVRVLLLLLLLRPPSMPPPT
ncbi:flavin-binding monooxygenase-like family protein [Neofusicoccum parvum]|nr:flavin-binding monooxygenase-like family protein [Neofusicoccum parvum]